MQPGDAYAFPHRKAFCLGTEFFDRSHNLVAGNQRRFFRRKFALNYVQVGAANATQFHAHEHFSKARFWPFHILKSKGICFDLAGRA